MAKWFVRVGHSAIAGLGLFALKGFVVGEFVIDYLGEIISQPLADLRERRYEQSGRGCCLFRLDAHRIVDATERGNVTRFINHSCEPNCQSSTIYVDGEWRIVIHAVRAIAVGEELSYDYRLTRDGGPRLACHCGAPRCRKFMD